MKGNEIKTQLTNWTVISLKLTVEYENSEKIKEFLTDSHCNIFYSLNMEEVNKRTKYMIDSAKNQKLSLFVNCTVTKTNYWNVFLILQGKW